MPSPPVRVAKLGGSLLDWPLLASGLRTWLAAQPGTTLLIGGGGAAVEELRAQHQHAPLDESAAHWACIDAMSRNTRQVAQLCPELPIESDFARLVEQPLPTNAVLFDPAAYLRHVEPHQPGTRLPESWDVTSDSIAARVAIALSVTELVLLKSCPAPPSAVLQDWADGGYVDAFLPRLAAKLPPVRWVNLRAGVNRDRNLAS